MFSHSPSLSSSLSPRSLSVSSLYPSFLSLYFSLSLSLLVLLPLSVYIYFSLSISLSPSLLPLSVFTFICVCRSLSIYISPFRALTPPIFIFISVTIFLKPETSGINRLRFSLAWWAYTFPMTDAAIATIWYAAEVKSPIVQSLSVFLSAISTLSMTGLLVATAIHACFLRDLFPNDLVVLVPFSPSTHHSLSLPSLPKGEPVYADEINEPLPY